jgi:hypothetical protein
MIDIDKFIKELKPKVDYEPKSKIHWLGMWILTNKDMKLMCSNRFGREYDLLTYKEQKAIREQIFRELRGIEDD